MKQRSRFRTWLWVVLIALITNGHVAFALESNAEVCAELSGLLQKPGAAKYAVPSRRPSQSEMASIDSAKLEILQSNDYAVGADIVDLDNDGVEDLFVWSIAGSGRFGSGEIHTISKKSARFALTKLAEIDLGVLQSPRVIRFKNQNYLVTSDDGDSDSLRVRRIEKTGDGQLKERTICLASVVIQSTTQCRHPACRELARIAADEKTNIPFRETTWPHKYFAPAGASIFFPDNPVAVDFDNIKVPTKLWRLGREGYGYQHISWSWLAIGDQEPEVGKPYRVLSDNGQLRQVLPGAEQNRLKNVINQQSQALSRQLGKPVALLAQGQFFFLDANDRTYWVWDLDDQPYGDQMHIMYSNANKSDYVGTVRLTRTQKLAPCVEKCTKNLAR